MNPFGWWIALYFALATVAAGLAGAGCVLLRRGDANSLLRARTALLFAVCAMSIGFVALIADLEHPMEFWLTLRHYNPASWISRGSRIAMLFWAVGVLLLLVVQNGEDRGHATQLGIPILAALAIALAIYPSLVLGQELGRPNWQSPWLPFVFAAGAVHAAASILRTSLVLELAAVALEVSLFAGYLIDTDNVTSAVRGPALEFMLLAFAFSWFLPTTIRSESIAATGLRAGSLVVGCFGVRSAILITGANRAAWPS